MSGRFILATDAVREQLDWGQLGWNCRPADTGAKNLVVIDVTLKPGGGHAFHKHPNQEEVIVVLSGQVQQWLGEESCELGPGDSVFMAADEVHASFNTSDQDAKLLAILGPCVDEDSGYEVVEVADEAPWNELR